MLEPEFHPGLEGLEGFSHLILLTWLHLAGPPRLAFTPPFDTARRGVFATRAPHRPNPIGLSVVGFEGFDAPGVLRVRYLDCVNGTPLLDIKPYLPSTDAEPGASMGWLAPHATPRAAGQGGAPPCGMPGGVVRPEGNGPERPMAPAGLRRAPATPGDRGTRGA